jgi:hypothetical protein
MGMALRAGRSRFNSITGGRGKPSGAVASNTPPGGGLRGSQFAPISWRRFPRRPEDLWGDPVQRARPRPNAPMPRESRHGSVQFTKHGNAVSNWRPGCSSGENTQIPSRQPIQAFVGRRFYWWVASGGRDFRGGTGAVGSGDWSICASPVRPYPCGRGHDSPDSRSVLPRT